MQQSGFRFSRQEEKVLALSMTGLSDPEIADKMQIGLGTVRTFWKRIRSKTGGSTRAEVLETMARTAAHTNLPEEEAPNVQLLSEITRRQAAEQSAEAERRVVEALLDSVAEAVIVHDGNRIESSNRLASEKLGLKPGTPFRALLEQVPSSDRSRMLQLHATDGSPASPLAFETTIRERSFNVRSTPLDGRWVVTLMEAEKKTAMERGGTDSVYEKVFHRTRVGLGVIDSLGAITLANDRFAELLGHTVKAMLGLRLPAFVTFSDRKRLETALARADNEGDAQAGLTMLHANGGLVPVLLDISTSRSETDDRVRILTVRRTAETGRRF
jgi:PAS domain S-box-containing protein